MHKLITKPLFLALCVLVFIAPLTAPTIFAQGPVAPDFYKALWLQIGTLILLAFLFVFKARNNKPNIRLNSWQFSLMLFLAWASLSLLWAFHVNLGQVALLRFLLFGLLFFVACQIITNDNKSVAILFCIWLSAVIVSLIGLDQHFGSIITQEVFLQAAPPASTFGNRNMAMHFVVIAFPLGWWFLMKAQKPWQIFLTAIASVLMFAYIFHSGNRTSLIAVFVQAIALLFFVFIMAKNKSLSNKFTTNHIVSLTVAAVILFVLLQLNANGWTWFTDYLGERYFTAENYVGKSGGFTSFGARLTLYYNSIFMILDNWFLGVGIGNWTVWYPYYTGNHELIATMMTSNPQSTILYKQTHNEFIQIIAELGIVGTLLALLCVCMWVSGIIKLLKHHNKHPHAWLWIAICIGVIGLSINASASFPFRVSIPFMVIAIYLAVIHYYVRTLVYEPKSKNNKEKNTISTWFSGRANIELPVLVPVAWGFAILCLVGAYLLYSVYSVWIYAHKDRNLSASFLMGGKPKTALFLMKRSIKTNPADLDDGYYIMGNLYKNLKLYSQAAQTYEYALKHSLPYHPYMFTQLFLTYMRNGNYNKAHDTLQRAIKLMPKQDGYYAHLGSFYGQAGKGDKAVEMYKKTLALNPKHPKAEKMRHIIKMHQEFKNRNRTKNIATQPHKK